MLGSIIGDIVGSIYECNPIKTTNFPLFQDGCTITDDSIMTVAVAHALMDGYELDDLNMEEELIIKMMRYYCGMYPNVGYGALFHKWIFESNAQPYNSFGNGSAMRVASVGWLYDSLAEVLTYAKLSSAVTHNHPEGIKGAQAVAVAVYLARTRCPKEEIKAYIEQKFGYHLDYKIDTIRQGAFFDETCPRSIEEAIVCFLESSSFEDAIRLAVSLGADSDTQAAIAGGIAEAYYGIPDSIIAAVSKYIPEPIQAVVDRFKFFINRKAPSHKNIIDKDLYPTTNSEHGISNIFDIMQSIKGDLFEEK